MTLSPTATPIQHPLNSSTDAAALRAATLSFSKQPLPSSNQAPNYSIINRASTGGTPSPRAGTAGAGRGLVLAAQQSLSKDSTLQPYDRSLRSLPKNTLNYSSSSSMVIVAANLAAATAGGTPGKDDYKWNAHGEECEGEDILPARGTVGARRRLFGDDGDARQAGSSALRESGIQLVKADNKPSSSDFKGVDATSLEDISSLKNLFEKSMSGQSPTTQPIRPSSSALHAPKSLRSVASPDNPSLIAAVLATQLSPSNSEQNSRRSSPNLKSVATIYGNPNQSGLPDHLNSPDALPKISLPPPSRMARHSMSSTASKESVASTHNNALLAATLASKSKNLPPKRPPPRRIQAGTNTVISISKDQVSGVKYDSDGTPVHSAIAKYSKYNSAHSPISLKLDSFSVSTVSLPQYSIPSAPPLPKRRRSIGHIPRQNTSGRSSAALTAAVLSAASSRDPSPSPTHSSHAFPILSPQPRHLKSQLTGDSVRAAFLAPSSVTSPAPKKPPALPAPRRSRRKSLPPLPKTGLRETMRKLSKTPPKDTSPQRFKPHLVRHHPHKHSESERRRWRHFVTESERKRYEGLWAANKGLILISSNTNRTSSTTPSAISGTKPHVPYNFQQHVWSSTPNYTEPLTDCIDSLVARDIWSRSRLPFDHLADVWNLVDRGEKGHLSRDEFIIGTWLVDQSLKGRKLPASVQDEAWQSVRRLGVKVQPVNQREGNNVHNGSG